MSGREAPESAEAEPPTIAFDALGSEQGADAVVEGVGRAVGSGIRVRVFGRRSELSDLGALEGVEVIDCDQLIGNEEDPVQAVRSRTSSSVVMAAADVAEGRAAALASPGSTGATMAAALFALKRIRAVKRPALAVQLPAPGLDRPVLMLDVGANSECRSSHLVQFAHLGSAFAEAVLEVESPRVALLSVGAEAKKGSGIVVDAHEALADGSGINFSGNIEGNELLSGAADVVVTDGFTGNVTLKTIEGTAGAVGSAIGDAARSNPISMVGGLLMRGSLDGLRQRMDPDVTGGAILLGLRGVAIVGHGSAGPEGIANQIRLAATAVRASVVERTATLLADSGVGRSELRESSDPKAQPPQA